MKIIDIPAPVKIGGRDFTFADYLLESAKQYPPFCSENGTEQYEQIKEVIQSINGEAIMRVGPSDYDIIQKCVANAQWANAEVNLAFKPFRIAVKKAQDVEPAAKK